MDCMRQCLFCSAIRFAEEQEYWIESITRYFHSDLQIRRVQEGFDFVSCDSLWPLWPHGQPIRKLPSGKRAIFCPESKVGACADYCGGPPCVESAVISALSLADAIAAHRDGKPLTDDVVTSLDLSWDQVAVPLPWEIAHFPGMPEPPRTPDAQMLEHPGHCCPTHDWLGVHPGLAYGRTAALKPWERDNRREERRTIRSGNSGKNRGSQDNILWERKHGQIYDVARGA